MKPQDRIDKALKFIHNFGNYQSADFKQWTLDQIVRILTDCPEIITVTKCEDFYHEDIVLGENEAYRQWLVKHRGQWDEGVLP